MKRLFNFNLEMDNTVDDWDSIIPGDKDFDVEYLIKSITRKLGKMYDYFINKYEDNKYGDISVSEEYGIPYAVNAEEYRKISNELKLCYNLGYKILTYNYVDIENIPQNFEDDLEDYLLVSEMAISQREEDIRIFFKNLSNMANGWYVR